MSEGKASVPGIPSEYYGRPTLRLESDHCWIDVLAVGGPRIMGFGFPGGGNVLGETPQARWDVGHRVFDLLGGHRLWFAPETPDCSVPDSTGVTLAPVPGATGPAVRLTGTVEAPTGLRKTFEVRLDSESAAVSVRHIVTNEGSAAGAQSARSATGVRACSSRSASIRRSVRRMPTWAATSRSTATTARSSWSRLVHWSASPRANQSLTTSVGNCAGPGRHSSCGAI